MIGETELNSETGRVTFLHSNINFAFLYLSLFLSESQMDSKQISTLWKQNLLNMHIYVYIACICAYYIYIYIYGGKEDVNYRIEEQW